MKHSRFIIVISICFILFFFGISVYLYDALQTVLLNTVYQSLGYTLMAVLIFFLLMSTIILIYCIDKSKKKEIKYTSISTLVFMSDNGEVKKELDISERQSVLIGKGEMVDIDLSYFMTEEKAVAAEHAVLNLVDSYWYIEAITENYKVGLRHEYDNTIYKLKYFTPYKLTADDIIYVSDIKIIVR